MVRKAETSEDEGPTVENWSDKDQKILVTEGNGFLYQLQLRAKVDGDPDTVYDVLTDPSTVGIFRSIKECTYRRVIEDDGKGKRKLEVGHRATARFLFLSVTFETSLLVEENDRERKIHFQNAKEGFMKKFDGSWHIEPFTQETLDHIKHPNDASYGHHHGWFNPLSVMQSLHLRPQHKPSSALVTLEQAILPKTPAPLGVKHLIRRLCAKQLQDMMEDLRAEVERRKRGESQNYSRRVTGRHAAIAAACMLLAQPTDIWQCITPINIVVKL